MLGMKDYKINNSDAPSWKRVVTRVDCRWHSKTLLLHGLKNDSTKYNPLRGGIYVGKKNIRTIVVMFALLVAFSYLILFSSPILSFQIFNQVLLRQIIQVSFRYNKYTISYLLAPYLNFITNEIGFEEDN